MENERGLEAQLRDVSAEKEDKGLQLKLHLKKAEQERSEA